MREDAQAGSGAASSQSLPTRTGRPATSKRSLRNLTLPLAVGENDDAHADSFPHELVREGPGEQAWAAVGPARGRRVGHQRQDEVGEEEERE